MIPKVAIVGANGFVGSRLIEVFHLGQIAKLRPVVRGFGGLARLARFELDWRVADARDARALTSAFEGCDVVVNLVVGDAPCILENATAVYTAAQAAGIKRLIHLSSASVHGQAPVAGTDERSPLHTNHAHAYNNAKVRAERALMALRARGKVQLVTLRPGIVFGPRSRWITDTADQLLSSTAWLVNDGTGICNSIYVDNLIEAIRLAMFGEHVDSEVFLVGDREQVTWRDFYRPIADALGVKFDDIRRVAAPHFEHSWKEKIENIRVSKPVQAILPAVPAKLKAAVRAALVAVDAPTVRSPWMLPAEASPVITEEMCLLQSCSVKLPWRNAEQKLGYQPPVTFAEGMRRSIGWLAFAGYPVGAPVTSAR